MNLETEIDPELWKTIQTQYEKQNFTDAIKDAIYYLSNLIRERTGLENDGVSLIGQAFGGNSPKLKVNQMQTESEINIQKGVEQILRGIYQAIRNPRSHEKYTDSKHDAESIIVFINYMIKVIIQAKAPFSKEEFLKHVFDPDFVQDSKYAELLLKQIPRKKFLEVFIEIFRKKENANKDSLRVFISTLIARLDPSELKEAFKIVSEELINSSDEATLRIILAIMPTDSWSQYDLIGRHRIENMLIKSIEGGKYAKRAGKCLSGSFGTSVTRIKSDYFLRKEDLIYTISNKLWSDNDSEKDYIFEYLFSSLKKYADPPGDYLAASINNGLNTGDERFREALRFFKTLPQSWQEAFGDSYSNFKKKEITQEQEEDIPF